MPSSRAWTAAAIDSGSIGERYWSVNRRGARPARTARSRASLALARGPRFRPAVAAALQLLVLAALLASVAEHAFFANQGTDLDGSWDAARVLLEFIELPDERIEEILSEAPDVARRMATTETLAWIGGLERAEQELFAEAVAKAREWVRKQPQH